MNNLKKIIVVFVLTFATFSNASLFQEGNKIVANGKGVILIFDSNACSYCGVLKADLKDDKKLNAFAKKFNIYLIPKEEYKEYEMGDKVPATKVNTTSLAIAYNVKGSPNVLIFDKHWNKIFHIPGYADPKQMTTFLKFVDGLHNGKYLAKDWQKYLKEEGVY